jgi:hypothetical protein
MAGASAAWRQAKWRRLNAESSVKYLNSVAKQAIEKAKKRKKANGGINQRRRSMKRLAASATA